MSKLTEIFESIKATLHWGPSVEPFHKAVIVEHDALELRVKALEDKWDGMFPKWPECAPQYIADPKEVVLQSLCSAAPDDAASITDDVTTPISESNPAEPSQKPVLDLLGASTEPVPAGPTTDEKSE